MAEPSANSFGSPMPVFRVKNVDASIVYYLEALGFELRWRAGDGFACVARNECSIFLTNDNQSQPRVWVWIGVQDVRGLHRHYMTSGAKIRNPLNNFEMGAGDVGRRPRWERPAPRLRFGKRKAARRMAGCRRDSLEASRPPKV